MQSYEIRNNPHLFSCNKGRSLHLETTFVTIEQFLLEHGLLTQSELADDSTIALYVLFLYIVQQSASLTYQTCQGPFCTIIFTVGLHVLRQMGNTV